MIVGRLFDRTAEPVWQDPRPIRGELFGIERLEEHAASLAAAQPVAHRPARSRALSDRLADNAAYLVRANRAMARVADDHRQVTPAAEWLIDNYHLVDMQIREIGIDLPPGFYAELPKLAHGPFAGLPRVFGAMWSLVAHSDSLIDPEALRRYLMAYQAVEPLTIGELWAVPITLRIVLIENLRRIAEAVVDSAAARQAADALADRLLGAGGHAAEPPGPLLAAIGEAPPARAFAVQLAHRLRGQDAGHPASAWLERLLARDGEAIDTVVQGELLRQGASNATIRNIITSLRAIAGADWTELFERVCLVDDVLAGSGAYRAMDFPTRNLYRTAVEVLARGSRLSEVEVARRAVARAAGQPGARLGDPGHSLIAGGRPAFEAEIGFRARPSARLGRAVRACGIAGYGAAVLAAAAALLAVPLALLGALLGVGLPWLLALAAVGFVPASDAAVACVNRLATWSFGASLLPGMELRDGIRLRTMIVVPTLLVSARSIAEQVARLEIHWLASRCGAGEADDLHLALLSDWTDSPAEHAEGDAALLAAARDGVARLNAQHGPAPGGARFLLLHRRRVWNAGEACWIGWERKRGKLHELNQALRGAAETTFLDASAVPQGVRYVVTLDSDTRLPRDAVRRLVGKMAHPLNAPRLDPACGRVVEGHAVLQPRVTPSLPSGDGSSVFQRVFSSMDGIDPYAAAVSDVYQDLFGEGSYAGKGIYDVDAFDAALRGRVADSTLLSHDLFEGVFARAGLASDIEVVEDFPTGYAVAALRQHRWARGDWQLLPWVMRRSAPKVMPAIGRWKMLDNLRRTLSAPAAVLALFVGWLLPPGPALGWSAFVVFTIALPGLLPVLANLSPGASWVSWRSYAGVLGAGLRHAAGLAGLTLVLMAHQAVLMADAIGRTLHRITRSRRHLLQWVAAAQSSNGPALSLAGTFGRMAGAPALALAAWGVAVAARPGAWWVPLPFALAWAASPAVAFWASRCAAARPLDAADVLALRETARRTWRFFETFVTAADHMLPPDNFQEDPAPVVARRSSPTNFGLYLLAVGSAHDFGWIGLADAVDRLEATMATVTALPRFHGHFYNWYDTSDLRPLEPRYVSTVDSGNLAGHLIALANACRGWREDGASTDQAGHDDARRLAAREDPAYWAEAAERTIVSRARGLGPPGAMAARLRTLEQAARAMALAMEFGFLRNPDRKLLSIGYLAAEGALDENCYDLLASEARLAVFVAIAKGDVPAREWFRLGRAVTPTPGGAALVSWSGSMFEYLMPSLVMRAPEGSLIEETNRLIVRRQVAYGVERGLPWGVSESAYNVRDVGYTYQYSNFGVPGLGLKRGLDEDMVVAPYATALAAMVDPSAAVRNFARLAEAGALGRYGFYEAVDYTPGRAPDGRAVVRASMAHHQGMTIVAIADAVLGGRMRGRFHAEPMVQATDLLLQERAPRNVGMARPLPLDEPRANGKAGGRADEAPSLGRRHDGRPLEAPMTHLLSNGRYSVMLTEAGAGSSRWQGLALTRWREDPTRDDWGAFVMLRDVHGGAVWSATLQPMGAAPDEYDVAFSEDRAEFARRDGQLTTMMEVLVSSEEDAEVRRISVTNAGSRPRTIEITSYAELALSPQAADVAHPAFNKMFVQTECLPELGAIVATRRRRTPGEPEIWAAHLLAHEGGPAPGVTVETDRARFLGRGRGLREAEMLQAPLSGTCGTVLDAVFALRCRVVVPAGGMARVAFWTMAADSRAALTARIDKHRDQAAFDRASTLAWTQAQVQLRHLGIRAAEAELFQTLAGPLLYAGPALRPGAAAIARGAGPQSGLWGQGISGDLPILLLRIRDEADLDVARQALLAHEYFRLKQFAVDLVILNEHAASYAQGLQGGLEALVRAQPRHPDQTSGKPGAVVLLRADLVADETVALLASGARVVIVAERGRLSDQLRPPSPLPRAPAAPLALTHPPGQSPPTPALEFYNGLGGFAEDGRAYVVVLGPGQATPAPWVNVVANAGFGFLAAAEGSGFTWAGNSRENQLTPWSNDPVANQPGEAFYLRDDATRDVWCPTAAPRRDPAATYLAHHGRGYCRFDRVAGGIASSLVQFVPVDDPVKVSRLTLRNLSGRARSISVTAYVEWVLGASRPATAPFVATEVDGATGALFARNRWSAAFGGRVAFADLGGAQTSWTGDRRAFLGRHGTLDAPAAMAADGRLSGMVGARLDPCGALRATIRLEPGAEASVVLFLGEAESTAAAQALVARLRTTDLDAVMAAVRAQWDAVLGAVVVTTPDRSMDLMLNGWLLYQTLACRVWARAGFYQASGAYGFRDQLQDGMALVASRPDLVRAHLLRAAGRQFVEGDVQHWWLPESGMGVRTRIADDRAWLAFTAAHYVAATGDAAVLDEPVAFLAAPVLAAGEIDRFFAPEAAAGSAPLFEHCALALDRSLAVGSHGLPLMGTGDWNDGMSRVGEAGRGESVWLGWFLHASLLAFAPLAEGRGDARAAVWRAHAAALLPALEAAWDGAWYARAYFDDGSPLGVAADDECRIDAIAQSWAVLSGAAPPARAAAAMASIQRELVREDERLMLVLAPPFDRTPRDPGYIKGYPPGLRENGGQYTHAAAWSVLATAALGDGARAVALFAMLNPVNRTRTPADVARYKVEPYAVVADVYAVSPHAGRGGWSWYTGSAGWLQRAGVEGILGLRILNGALHIDPRIPPDWPGFEATLAWRSARYRVIVERGATALTLDGAPAAAPVPLRDDGALHTVVVRLG